MSFSYLENPTDVVLLKTVANSLFAANYTFADDEDWAAVLNESLRQTVCYLSFDGIKGYNIIPNNVSNTWFKYIGSYMKSNMIVNQNHLYVDRIMKENNIPYCILKGAASEYYYPNPLFRAMGDVDFIVPKKDLEKASQIFIEKGFEMSKEEHENHRVFKKGHIHLEMHFEVAGMPEGANREIAEAFLADIFEKSSNVSLCGINFQNPSAFHHGLILLFHTYHHMLSEGIGLRHLCDWAVFVNSLSNDEFTQIFEDKLKKIGLWRFAQILSATSCEFLKMPYKEWIGSIDEKLCREIVEDIFCSGNFGNKDKTRSQQGSMISNRGANGIKGTKFTMLIKSKNKEALYAFPILKKIPLLKPFGFIFMGIRYSLNVITGKRKALNLKKITSETDKRKNIYSHFKLFEKEE